MEKYSLVVFQVFTWGQNGSGQLGLGNSANQPLPRKVGGSLSK